MTSRAVRWRFAFADLVIAIVAAVLVSRLSAPAVRHAAVAAAAVAPVATVTQQARPHAALGVLRAQTRFVPSRLVARNAPPVDARAAILVDMDSGRILFAQNAYQQLPPASTIKLLTAIVALHNFDPDRLVTATADALQQDWDESKMGLRPGDTLSVQELLTGMLTISANDAANVLAMDTVGMRQFVAAMNAQASALGLHDTHATSPVGLDDPAMRSSAYDIAVMAAVAVERFPLLRDIVDTQYTVLPASSLHPAFFLDNINLLLRMYAPAVGIKTGYTGDAGACEVGMAVRDGHRLISVILNGNLVYSSSRRLLDWGFTQYGLPSLLPAPTPSPSPAAAPH